VCGAWQDAAPLCGLCGTPFGNATPGEEPDTGRQTTAQLSAGTPSSHFGYGRRELLLWLVEGRLAAADFPQAVHRAGTIPGTAAWRRFLDRLALWLGALFLAAAVVFFFAYNWQALGHVARFGIVELLLAGTVAATWRLGVERTPGKAALLVATLLVGALLALVGQTYQTGADPWELFASWAVCIIPWVTIARFSPLWLVLLALVNLAISLYFQAFAGFFGLLFGTETLWWMLTGVNTAALALWEFAASHRIEWLAERWAPRTVATAALGFLTVVAGGAIFDRQSSGFAEFICYCGWLAGAYGMYRYTIRDLYVLALGVLSVVIISAMFLAHLLIRNGGEAGAFLLVGMTVLGLSAVGGWWLRSVAQEVNA
jgi:uncharacterized membrane protein